MSDPAEALAAEIARSFRDHVVDEYVPRIGQCVARLSAEQLWQRLGEHNNSVANLLLHLTGNTRQWILAGIGGAGDHRDRDAEFAAGAAGAAKPSGAEMMAQLESTVRAAADLVDALDVQQILAVRRFQGRWDHTCAWAILHVLEHFSGHAGQIYAHTKQVLGLDLKFWDL